MKRSKFELVLENAIKKVIREYYEEGDNSLLDKFFKSIYVYPDSVEFNTNKYFGEILEEIENLKENVLEKEYYIQNNIKSIYQNYIKNGKEDEFWDNKFEYDTHIEGYLTGKWGDDVPSEKEYNQLLEEYKSHVNSYMENKIRNINDDLRFLDKFIIKLKFTESHENI